MRICFVPIDNRPVCYSLINDIASIDKSIELLLPSRNFLGDLTKTADYNQILNWLESISDIDAIILSLDTIAYGGLVPSRRSKDSFEEIETRLCRLKEILKTKKAKIYAFSSIMRISNNNYNEEEKEYWKDYGKKIFEYSFSNGLKKADIPEDIIQDYLNTRKRNFEVNKTYLKWQEEGLFDTLIFSKDDCAESGFNVNEAKELEKLGGKTKTGADEIPLSLFAKSIEKNISIYLDFLEPDSTNLISNYEDISIKNSLLGQLELCGFKLAENQNNADIILIINNFKEKQGELVMGWDTQPFNGNFLAPKKPYAIADVRFANGADNALIEQVFKDFDINNLFGYAGWNTSANTIGTLLATLKIRFKPTEYNEDAFKRMLLVRFLDDWAYQANIRKSIETTCNISELIKPYEKRILEALKIKETPDIRYIYPWGRKFEVEVIIEELNPTAF